MSATLKQFDWEKAEAKVRSFFRDWAANRRRLVLGSLSAADTSSGGTAGWVSRIDSLLEATDSPNSFSKTWSETLSASDSAIRAQYLADLLQSGYTIENLIGRAAENMAKELEFKEEIEARTHEALGHRLDHRMARDPWADPGGSDSYDFLGEYERQLAKYQLPMRLEPFVESALYALYIAASPRSRIVVPRNRVELVRGITVDTRLIRTISPRDFEELLYYVYNALGCRAIVTQATGDWGADLLAWQPGPFGTESLIVVQAKLYSPQRKVSLSGIHGLHGAVAHYQASTGHLVATADLTGPAKTFMDERGYTFIDLAKLGREVEDLLNKWGDS